PAGARLTATPDGTGRRSDRRGGCSRHDALPRDTCTAGVVSVGTRPTRATRRLRTRRTGAWARVKAPDPAVTGAPRSPATLLPTTSRRRGGRRRVIRGPAGEPLRLDLLGDAPVGRPVG